MLCALPEPRPIVESILRSPSTAVPGIRFWTFSWRAHGSPNGVPWRAVGPHGNTMSSVMPWGSRHFRRVHHGLFMGVHGFSQTVNPSMAMPWPFMTLPRGFMAPTAMACSQKCHTYCHEHVPWRCDGTATAVSWHTREHWWRLAVSLWSMPWCNAREMMKKTAVYPGVPALTVQPRPLMKGHPCGVPRRCHAAYRDTLRCHAAYRGTLRYHAAYRGT